MDFKVGDTVRSNLISKFANSDANYLYYQVTKVGKKYVYISNGNNKEIQCFEESGKLSENKEWHRRTFELVTN